MDKEKRRALLVSSNNYDRDSCLPEYCGRKSPAAIVSLAVGTHSEAPVSPASDTSIALRTRFSLSTYARFSVASMSALASSLKYTAEIYARWNEIMISFSSFRRPPEDLDCCCVGYYSDECYFIVSTH